MSGTLVPDIHLGNRSVIWGGLGAAPPPKEKEKRKQKKKKKKRKKEEKKERKKERKKEGNYE